MGANLGSERTMKQAKRKKRERSHKTMRVLLVASEASLVQSPAVFALKKSPAQAGREVIRL
jgi:hypothetical protein